MKPCFGGCHRMVTSEWCARCVDGLTTDVRRLQSLDPGQLIILADIFSIVGADTLTRIMVGALPFEEKRDE